MSGIVLSDADHVVRYARPTDFLDLAAGTLNCSAFQLRADEVSLSVNWLEHFAGLTKQEQLDLVRSGIQIRLGRNGRFAELNIGATLAHAGRGLPDLAFVHSPSPATAAYPADPSHSEIMGLPPADSPESELIGDLIAECVTALYPTIP